MNKTVETVLRILLALPLLFFGFNKFFHFLEMEAPPAEAGAFMGALAGTGYMFKLIAISEIVPGFLLLINKWKGLALVWLAPISVNIVAFHLKFDMAGIGPAAAIAILNIILIYANWDKFKSLF